MFNMSCFHRLICLNSIKIKKTKRIENQEVNKNIFISRTSIENTTSIMQTPSQMFHTQTTSCTQCVLCVYTLASSFQSLVDRLVYCIFFLGIQGEQRIMKPIHPTQEEPSTFWMLIVNTLIQGSQHVSIRRKHDHTHHQKMSPYHRTVHNIRPHSRNNRIS
jgi:hypothetical protein